MAIIYIALLNIFSSVLFLLLLVVPASYMFFSELGKEAGLYTVLLYFQIILMPIIGIFFANWLSKYLKIKLSVLIFLLSTLGAYSILQTDFILDNLLFKNLETGLNSFLVLGFIIKSLIKALTCAAVCALVIMLLNLLIELPVYFLDQALKLRLNFCYPALRFLVVLIFIGIASNLIIETIFSYLLT